MGETVRFAIPVDGDIQCIYDDELLPVFNELGTITRARASHVEPVDGSTEWQADMSPVGGPKLPATATRKESLKQEVDYLNERLGTLEIAV